jgi:hypothetical protein
MVFIGSVFSVGVDRMEHGELWLTTDEVNETDLMAMVERWTEDRRGLLRKYDTDVEQLFTAMLDSRLIGELLIYADTDTAMNEASEFFSKNEFESSVNTFLEVGRVLEQEDKGPDGTITNPKSRREIAEAYNSAGFVSAVAGDDVAAEKYLRRALQVDSYMGWLRHYNLAYLSALHGDFKSAVTRISKAEHSLANDVSGSRTLFMLAYFPTPSTWTMPDRRWNVLYMADRDRLPALITIQRRVYQVLAGELELTSDAVLLQDVEQPLHEGCRRLMAWAELTIRKNPLGARGWLVDAPEKADQASIEMDREVQEVMNMAEAYGMKVSAQPVENEEESVSYVARELAFVEGLLKDTSGSDRELDEGAGREPTKEGQDLVLRRPVQGGESQKE